MIAHDLGVFLASPFPSLAASLSDADYHAVFVVIICTERGPYLTLASFVNFQQNFVGAAYEETRQGGDEI